MKVDLAVTVGSIRSANLTKTDPLDLLRILNMVPPRDWNMRVIFDEVNQNHLRLAPSPLIEDRIILAALDGRVPSLYAHESISVRLGGKCFTCSRSDIEQAEKRATYLDFTPIATFLDSAQLVISGYPSTRQLLDLHALTEWCRRNTWLGSRKYRNVPYGFNIEVIGQKLRLRPEQAEIINNREPLFAREVVPLLRDDKMIGQYDLKYSFSGSCCARHERFGQFEPSKILPGFWSFHKNHFFSGASIEITLPGIEWYTGQGPLDTPQLRGAIERLRDNLAKLEITPEYNAFVDQVLEYRRVLTAARLSARQHRTQHAPTVWYRNHRLMRVPTCENELVALYMKMEAMGCLPFECEVIEYTSRDGIDALADFRLSSTGAYIKLGPVEFELFLERYLAHDHAPEQTALILCWDTETEGATNIDVEQGDKRKWLLYLQVSGHRIPTILLSRIPGITIRTGQ